PAAAVEGVRPVYHHAFDERRGARHGARRVPGTGRARRTRLRYRGPAARHREGAHSDRGPDQAGQVQRRGAGPHEPAPRGRRAHHPGLRGAARSPAVVAYEHHIMLNGDGYPTLTFRRDCHYASKLVHVCDVYDALRTNRPYREAWSQERTLGYLEG